MMTKTKHCGRCHEHKSLDAFHNDKARPDGKYPTCKACRRIYAQSAKGKQTRQRWVDAGGLERAREYAKQPEVKARRNIHLKSRRQEIQKRQVREKTIWAIRAGLLHHPAERLCLACYGPASEHHHHDYRNHLDVTPLCHDCHMGLHAYMRHNNITPIMPERKAT